MMPLIGARVALMVERLGFIRLVRRLRSEDFPNQSYQSCRAFSGVHREVCFRKRDRIMSLQREKLDFCSTTLDLVRQFSLFFPRNRVSQDREIVLTGLRSLDRRFEAQSAYHFNALALE